MMASKKLLIAEDEKPMGNALKMKLESLGFSVTLVGNGYDALEALSKSAYDLVLLDLVMPKVDGFKVLQKIQESGVKTPVIVLSNLSQSEDEAKVKKLGAKGFFIKSNTTIAEIVEHINKFFGS